MALGPQDTTRLYEIAQLLLKENQELRLKLKRQEQKFLTYEQLLEAAGFCHCGAMEGLPVINKPTNEK